MGTSRTATGFSLIEGGPWFNLQRAAHLVGVTHDVFRRSLLLGLVGWLPPIVIGAIAGMKPGAFVPLHTRFLVAIPLLLWAEGFVDSRVREAVEAFAETGIVAGDGVSKLGRMVSELRQLLESGRALLAIVALAFGLAVLGDVTNHAPRAHAADLWITYLSLPLFRVVLLLWFWRWIVWATLLGRISRLDLRLVATHPDLAGGVGFLEQPALAFIVVMLAAGVVLSGELAVSSVSSRSALIELVEPVAGFGVIVSLTVLGPLLFFMRKLIRAKRLAQLDYGALATRHNRAFAEKWLEPGGEDSLGAPSISSLADLGTSFGFIQQMRLIPFSRQSLLWVLVACAMPAIPPLFARIPVEEMVKHVVKGLLL